MDKKVVYSYYCLDILHAGHLQHMKNAKALVGDEGISVVGILTGAAVLERKKNLPIMSLEERMRVAEAVRYVDLAVPQATYSPVANILGLKPDIVVESESHTPHLISVVRKAAESYGGKLVVLPYYPGQSSTALKKKIKSEWYDADFIKLKKKIAKEYDEGRRTIKGSGDWPRHQADML